MTMRYLQTQRARASRRHTVPDHGPTKPTIAKDLYVVDATPPTPEQVEACPAFLGPSRRYGSG